MGACYPMSGRPGQVDGTSEIARAQNAEFEFLHKVSLAPARPERRTAAEAAALDACGNTMSSGGPLPATTCRCGCGCKACTKQQESRRLGHGNGEIERIDHPARIKARFRRISPSIGEGRRAH